MEDILISAARTIIDQSHRIDELEIIVNELSNRLDMVESNGYCTVDRMARTESNLNNEQNRNRQFINDLFSVVSRHRNCEYIN